jgi:hypothetical protein
MGDALICFRIGTMKSPLRETPSSRRLSQLFLAYQMPECQVTAVFQHFRSWPSLDNGISGIPNAMLEPILGKAARAADEPKIDVKEEANVQSQRCGPPDP